MSIEWVYARRQLDSAVEKLLGRVNAFQSVTIIPPLPQLFLALDSFKESASPAQLDAVVSFIDDSFAHFMQRRFSIIDEARSLGVQDELDATLSFVVLAFQYQWQTLMVSGAATVPALSQWLVDFLLRLYYIGEHPTLICNFIWEIEGRHTDPLSVLADPRLLLSSSPPQNHLRLTRKSRYYRQ
jgi:hypothetical protein